MASLAAGWYDLDDVIIRYKRNYSLFYTGSWLGSYYYWHTRTHARTRIHRHTHGRNLRQTYSQKHTYAQLKHAQMKHVQMHMYWL